MTRGYLLQKLTLRGSIFGLKNATLTLVDPLCILQPHKIPEDSRLGPIFDILSTMNNKVIQTPMSLNEI